MFPAIKFESFGLVIKYSMHEMYITTGTFTFPYVIYNISNISSVVLVLGKKITNKV